uniref:Uncharacterized protein n=1 Tax=Cacopsylla melanoneura TaxID=428564 RepID=A0A8D9AJX2_9HEMI
MERRKAGLAAMHGIRGGNQTKQSKSKQEKIDTRKRYENMNIEELKDEVEHLCIQHKDDRLQYVYDKTCEQYNTVQMEQLQQIEQLSAEKEAMTAKNKDYEVRIGTILEEYNEQMDDHSKQMKDAEHENRCLKQKVRELQTSEVYMKEDYKRLQQENDGGKITIEALRGTIDELKRKNVTLQHESYQDQSCNITDFEKSLAYELQMTGIEDNRAVEENIVNAGQDEEGRLAGMDKKRMKIQSENNVVTLEDDDDSYTYEESNSECETTIIEDGKCGLNKSEESNTDVNIDIDKTSIIIQNTQIVHSTMLSSTMLSSTTECNEANLTDESDVTINTPRRRVKIKKKDLEFKANDHQRHRPKTPEIEVYIPRHVTLSPRDKYITVNELLDKEGNVMTQIKLLELEEKTKAHEEKWI